LNYIILISHYVIGDKDNVIQNRDFLLKQYEILAIRKNHRDTFVWAIPAIIVAAEVSLISAVIATPSWKSAWPISAIGIGLGTLSFQLMSRHYYLAKLDEYRLAELEKEYFPLWLYTTPVILKVNLSKYMEEKIAKSGDDARLQHYKKMYDKISNPWNPGLYHSAPYWKGLVAILGWIPLMVAWNKHGSIKFPIKNIEKLWNLRK